MSEKTKLAENGKAKAYSFNCDTEAEKLHKIMK